MGLLGIVSAVIVAISMAGLGTTISETIRAAVCRIAGLSCDAAGAMPTSHVPQSACETNYESREVSADVVVFSVDVGGTAKLGLSRTVDKDGKVHWYVQQEGELRVGADVLFGEKAGLGNLGDDVSAELKAFLKGAGGAKMEFATEQDARDFITAAQHEVVKRAVTGWDPTGLGHWIADQVDGYHYDPPAPTEYFFDGGAKVEAGADAKVGAGKSIGVGVKGGSAGVVGVRIKPNADGTSNKTVYLKMTQDAAFKLGIADAVQGEVGLKTDVVVALEYDGKGNPKTFGLDAALTGKLQGSLNTPVTGEKTVNIGKLAPKGKLKLADQLGGAAAGKARFTIDLTKGNNVNVVADALHSVGVPVLTDHGADRPPDPITAAEALYDLYDSGADGTYLSLTAYAAETGGGTAGIKGGDGLTFGADGAVKLETGKTIGGWYWQPGVGLTPWAACG